MEVEAAKLIGAGLAVIGLGGVGAGIGHIFASLISAIARNPSARPQVFPMGMLGFALVEAVALYALLIAFLTGSHPEKSVTPPPRLQPTIDIFSLSIFG